MTDPFTSAFLVHYQQSIALELSRLQETLQTERRSRLETEETDAQYFCSHTVATVLKAMGVLPQSHEDSLCSPGGKSAQDLAAAIQRMLSEGNKQEEEGEKVVGGDGDYDDEKVGENDNDHDNDQEEDKENDNAAIDVKKVRKAVETVKKDISTLLTPEDLSYLQTQLHLTKALGRASPATLRAFLQAMTMSLPSPVSSVEASISLATRFRSPPPAWRSARCSAETSTSTTGRRPPANHSRSVAASSRCWASPPTLPMRSSSRASPQTMSPRWLVRQRQMYRRQRLRR